MTQEPEILFTITGAVGVVTLNRPQALNALTFDMVRQLDQMLITWTKDPAIKAVILTGAGSRAFCAGGDVKTVAMHGMAAMKKGEGGGAVLRDFFREEYTLNHRIFTFPKPYISLINGIVMGGGMGISAHGSHRVITENALFAMPETSIGFFPDVGGGYFLPRCPGQIGTYLALTSNHIKAFDTMHIGFATHFVPAVHLARLNEEIIRSPHDLDALLKKYSTAPSGESDIIPYHKKINRYFSHNHIEDILRDLEKDSSAWAIETLKTMNAVSPTSLKIALKQIRLGAKMSFSEVMTMEYRLSQACLARHDFYEGIRAALIDKDRKPKWQPLTVDAVSDADIEDCFQSLGSQDLVLSQEVLYNTRQRK
ncbi:MAG: enoyl-CoA hydratase/isomerase family protein [Proteobacteria bacterium]|nr:enoyl-CoA hydratase/isomerase family protein [Pseudomonadota bacterium]